MTDLEKKAKLGEELAGRIKCYTSVSHLHGLAKEAIKAAKTLGGG